MENQTNEPAVTLRDYTRVLFRQRWVIITCFAAVMITVYLGLEFKTPVYESQVKMLITAEKQVDSQYYKELYAARDTQAALTQSEIVKSNPVLERAVRAINLHLRPLDHEKQHASRLKYRLIDWRLRKIKSELGKYTPREQQSILFRLAVENLKKNVKVEPIRDTNLFSIKASDFNPVGAAVIANVISRSYVIFDLEQQLAELTLKYGEKHPTVSQLRDNIRKMESNLSGEPLSDIEAIGPASVKIIEQATPSMEPSGPPKPLILVLASFMSLFLGVMLAYIFDYMDQTFKSPQDIKQQLGLPLLGSIPRRRLGEGVLINNINSGSVYNRFYQKLSEQVYMLAKDNSDKNMLISSTEENEGAAEITANLGNILAQKAKYDILIIDADFRRPRLHKFFRINKKSPGLSDVLLNKTALNEAVTSAAPNLDVITAGRTESDPVSLLDSVQFTDILNTLKNEYEVVLINCPDIKNHKDAEIISRKAGGTVLVIKEGQTRRQVVKNVLGPFRAEGHNLLGVVLNNRTFPIPGILYGKV